MATQPQNSVRVEDDRTGMNPETLERAVLDHLHFTSLKDLKSATPHDVYEAVAHTVRDRLVQRWMKTNRTYYERDVKRAYYLSAEYLLGRALEHNLINLGVRDIAEELISEYDISLHELLAEEPDPGLGNGGLGRLAACFMDSLATLELPAVGYGIRYEFGIFDQKIEDGRQIERADDWLRMRNPWEHPRHDYAVKVQFYGRVDETVDEQGHLRVRWLDTQGVLGVPYDTPIAGYDNNTVNTLRLWSAKATKELNLQVFNDGDYRKAVEQKSISESISKVLYPNDRSPEGRELRLKQQYFFVCCSIADIIRRYKKSHETFDEFSDKAAIQLNDTHPAIAVAELMRVLVDQEKLPWEKAWEITTTTIGYTNHTLLPEALERWPVWMFERLLPRHLGIVYEINRRFLRQVHIQHPKDHELQRRLSIIEEGDERQIRMAHLAVVGSHSVNGVAALHSKLITERLLPDFYALAPEKFNNKTNGVTPRRWMRQCNPQLADLITDALGDEGWLKDLGRLKGLAVKAEDPDFHDSLERIKYHNKELLTAIIEERCGVRVDPSSLFDVQVKRLHQYKRQLMNCLHIIGLYWQIKQEPDREMISRTFIFGGKAAPGYKMAKQHIKLINDVAEIVNNDPIVQGRIKVAFLPNYNVSLAERIIPAADISEQISMAGKEASGTGNMKFAMNGALTLGTLDGANIEIREQVGSENFFLFGLDATEAKQVRQDYEPARYIERSELLGHVIELIDSGFFSPEDPSRFDDVVHDLRHVDSFLVCADFDAYAMCHKQVAAVWRDRQEWMRRVVCNISSMGKFSSDRTIQQYADDIWGLERTPIELD